MELLLAIGAEKPEFLLTGKTLRDQGLTVAGMLVSGWTPEHLRQVIAGRPLPPPREIKTTVGGLVAGRLRDALAGPPPGSVPRQGFAPAAEKETFTPGAYAEQAARDWADTADECSGLDGMCGRPVATGARLCLTCSGQQAPAPF